MKHQFKRSALICLATALCCAGCAKHEMVKQDQMIPAASTLPDRSAVPSEAGSNVARPALQDTSISRSSIKESPAEGQALRGAATEAALNSILFDFNSYTLSPAARETLAKNAAILQRKGNIKIRIEGHTDELGSDDYNLSLGEKRAKAALNYLESMGITSERLSVISYGKEKPANPGHDEDARAKNRRDELVIVSK